MIVNLWSASGKRLTLGTTRASRVWWNQRPGRMVWRFEPPARKMHPAFLVKGWIFWSTWAAPGGGRVHFIFLKSTNFITLSLRSAGYVYSDIFVRNSTFGEGTSRFSISIDKVSTKKQRGEKTKNVSKKQESGQSMEEL